MKNLNISELDPPTHLCQFDVKCGKIQYVRDPYSKKTGKTNRPSPLLIDQNL